MSIHLAVDHALRTVVVRAEGKVTYAQIRKLLLEERNYGGLPYPEIIDARNSKPEVSSDEVRNVVNLLRCLGQSSKLGPTAVIVGSPVGFGMIRMLEILSEDPRPCP